MKLIYWLWNHWINYENTRHNIWSDVLENYINSLWLKYQYSLQFNWYYCEYEINWQKIIFFKSVWFINNSWEYLKYVLNKYHVKNENILILHDDLDTEIWKCKIKSWWTSWWHKWVRNIINKLWTDQFKRLKIWIWRPNDEQKVSDYVLWKINQNQIQQNEIQKLIESFILFN